MDVIAENNNNELKTGVSGKQRPMLKRLSTLQNIVSPLCESFAADALTPLMPLVLHLMLFSNFDMIWSHMSLLYHVCHGLNGIIWFMAFPIELESHHLQYIHHLMP